MRKIFSILLVLMMVAGTFVSCSRPTDVSTGAGTSASSTVDFECTDGALKIVKNEYGEMYLCTKAHNWSNPYVSGTGIWCVGLKDYLPELDNNDLYVSDEEWKTAGTDATFDVDGVLVITCSILPVSEGIQTIKITSTNSTLKYKIVH